MALSNEIGQKGKYSIFQNAKGEIMIMMDSIEGNPENPRFIYDGGDTALLYRRQECSVAFRKIEPDARTQLKSITEILIVEFENNDIKREYEVPMRFVEDVRYLISNDNTDNNIRRPTSEDDTDNNIRRPTSEDDTDNNIRRLISNDDTDNNSHKTDKNCNTQLKKDNKKNEHNKIIKWNVTSFYVCLGLSVLLLIFSFPLSYIVGNGFSENSSGTIKKFLELIINDPSHLFKRYKDWFHQFINYKGSFSLALWIPILPFITFPIGIILGKIICPYKMTMNNEISQKKDDLPLGIFIVIILGLIWYYGVLTYGWDFGIWYIILFPFAFLITAVPLIIFSLIIIGEFKDFFGDRPEDFD